MPQEPLKLFKWNRPLTLERLQAVQHRLSTFCWETWCEVDRVQLHAEKRGPLRRGEFALFPVDPKPQPAEVTEHSVPVFPQLCSRLGKYEPVVQVVENANASFFPIYELCYIGAETREEGGTRCQRALTAEGDRGAEEIGQQEVAETASGCPRRWCWSKRRTGGTEGSLPCSWVEEGWLPSAMSGEEQGTGDSLLAALDRRSHRRPPSGSRVAVECSLGCTPRPARGDGGMWRVGRGRESWEQSKAG